MGTRSPALLKDLAKLESVHVPRHNLHDLVPSLARRFRRKQDVLPHGRIRYPKPPRPSDRGEMPAAEEKRRCLKDGVKYLAG
jgi:hypothetical protein